MNRTITPNYSIPQFYKKNYLEKAVKSLIILKWECDNLNYQIWEKIENGVSPVLLQAIVKSLIRFEREMVIEFTDNTVVLDMKYYQFYFMG